MSYRYRYGMNWIRQEKRLAIYMRDHFACCYCGAGIECGEVTLSLDHVEHKGGNEASNLVTACLDCNSLKDRNKLLKFVRELTVDDERKTARVLARVARAQATCIKQLVPKAKAIIKARREGAGEPF